MILVSLFIELWVTKKKNSAHEIYDENTTITGTHNKYVSLTNNLSQLWA